jgi:hypothetical protein
MDSAGVSEEGVTHVPTPVQGGDLYAALNHHVASHDKTAFNWMLAQVSVVCSVYEDLQCGRTIHSVWHAQSSQLFHSLNTHTQSPQVDVAVEEHVQRFHEANALHDVLLLEESSAGKFMHETEIKAGGMFVCWYGVCITFYSNALITHTHTHTHTNQPYATSGSCAPSPLASCACV